MKYSDLPDQQLILLIKNEDSRAFTVLFQRYFRSMYEFAKGKCKSETVAEELALDVMHKLWTRRLSLDPDCDLRAYLFTATRRAIIDHWRKQEVQFQRLEGGILNLMEDKAKVEEKLSQEDLQQYYGHALNKLNPKEKEAFLLSREEDLSYLEIAERMGISVNTVKTHLKSSLRTLRLILANHVDISFLILLLINILP